jgi:hypothetical protein
MMADLVRKCRAMKTSASLNSSARRVRHQLSGSGNSIRTGPFFLAPAAREAGPERRARRRAPCIVGVGARSIRCIEVNSIDMIKHMEGTTEKSAAAIATSLRSVFDVTTSPRRAHIRGPRGVRGFNAALLISMPYELVGSTSPPFYSGGLPLPPATKAISFKTCLSDWERTSLHAPKGIGLLPRR